MNKKQNKSCIFGGCHDMWHDSCYRFEMSIALTVAKNLTLSTVIQHVICHHNRHVNYYLSVMVLFGGCHDILHDSCHECEMPFVLAMNLKLQLSRKSLEAINLPWQLSRIWHDSCHELAMVVSKVTRIFVMIGAIDLSWQL